MYLWVLEFLLVLGLLKRVGSFPFGCTYNKSPYKEGEIVRTEDPCLSCICQKGALECNFRVCGEHARVLSPSCFLLHQPNHCCPQLFCDKNFNSTGIEVRTTYKVKNKLHGNDCNINGSVYAEGSAVASSQSCEYCYCFQAEVKCLKPRCLRFFEGCTPAFEKSSCCPTHYDCRNVNAHILTAQMKHFVSGNINFTHTNNFSMSLSNLVLKPERAFLNLSKNVETDSIKTKVEKKKEMISTVAEKRNKQGTVIEPGQEAPVHLAENHMSTLSSQTMRADHFWDEFMRVEFTKESTLATETDGNFTSLKDDVNKEADFQIRRKLHKFSKTEISPELNDGSRENAPKVEDYDSYDYGEPRLPASLPNLVIFPFVAADAVMKGESAGKANIAHKDKVENIDDHHFFYNDYFFPPAKTEGGFVPKEPQKLREPVHEISCSSKELVDGSVKGLKENAQVSPEMRTFPKPFNEMNFPKFADEQEEKAISAGNTHNNRNTLLDSFLQGGTMSDVEVVPVFQIPNETTSLLEPHQNKKPVTVTYKNFIVDFYPHYLVTTKKGMQSPSAQATLEEESFNLSTPKIRNSIASSIAAGEATSNFPDTEKKFASVEANQKNPAKTTSSPPATDISPFYPFVQSYSSKEITSTAAIMSTIKKHKFSSKIKSQLSSITSTAKSKRERISSTESGFDTEKSSLSAIEKPNIDSENGTPYKKDEMGVNFETALLRETKTEELGFSQSPKGGNISNENGEVSGSEDGENRLRPNEGSFLKLAGCNIYGMMYRVGKVIIELSEPCLECQCTDSGVQCKPIKC